MIRRVLLGVLIVLEALFLWWLYSRYSAVEWDILMVQGQDPVRYAELHRSWLQLSGGIILMMIALPASVYTLVRTWKGKRK
ncbi:MAG TPA: hypothetical protein VFV52_15900 [Bacilli bacterium]|nr:hypothetical protein [Bacilli bacterium]